MDIGNDGSAFVEVLVGSSAGGAGEQDYEVSPLLIPAPAAPVEASGLPGARPGWRRVTLTVALWRSPGFPETKSRPR